MLAHDPSADTPYWILALASYAEGKPLDAVRETLRQRVARLDPALRPRFELAHLWALDVLAGDFDAARGRSLELERSVASGADRRLHARAALWWASASLESGRGIDAARGAKAFLDCEDAWVADPRADDFAIARDPTPRLLRAELEGGALSPDEYERRRAAWVSAWRARAPAAYLPFVWLHGFAAVARSREDAVHALEEAPRFGGIPEFTPHVLGDAYVGTTYYLAERAADALPYLRRAARSCVAVESPFEHTRVHLVLGQALADTGDRAGACAAWGVVLARWGRARPRSVTADSSAVARAKPPVRRGTRREGGGAVSEEAPSVAAMFEQGRLAWPTVTLALEDFARFVGERAATDGERAGLFAADAYLACACAAGDDRALAEFDRLYVAQVPSFLAREAPSPGFVDEVSQRLRERLFVEGKIAQYTGRGSLGSWARVVTLRVASNLRRGERAHVALEDALPSPGPDPELAAMQARYGDAFKLALRGALEGLDAEERSLLRLHYVDGLNIDKIAVVFGVSRATIGRRMIGVRERVGEVAHRRLADELHATPEEIRSLLRLVRSRLTLTLSAALREA